MTTPIRTETSAAADQTGLRDRIIQIAPGFLQGPVGERVLYCFGFGADILYEKMTQGGLARMPTRCDVTALPIIAGDRVMALGPTESTDSKRERLQKAFESWQRAGLARGDLGAALPFALPVMPRATVVSTKYELDPARLTNVLTYSLGVRIIAATNASPVVITVEDATGFTSGDSVRVTGVKGNLGANGTWTATKSGSALSLATTTGTGTYTLGSGRVLLEADVPAPTYPPAAVTSEWYTYEPDADRDDQPAHVRGTAGGAGEWDWDSLSQVAGSYGWWGIFAILGDKGGDGTPWVEPATWAIGDPGIAIGSLPGSIGLSIDPELVASIARDGLGAWKPGHGWLRWMIITFDPALFDPTMPAGGGVNPDGLFGNWSKIVGGDYVPARFTDARYCDGAL